MTCAFGQWPQKCASQRNARGIPAVMPPSPLTLDHRMIRPFAFPTRVLLECTADQLNEIAHLARLHLVGALRVETEPFDGKSDDQRARLDFLFALEAFLVLGDPRRDARLIVVVVAVAADVWPQGLAVDDDLALVRLHSRGRCSAL